MATTTHNDSRTAHLLELMRKGDEAFNARDFETVDTVHHPDMIAYIPGSAEPIYGSEAHSAAMQQFLRSFPDMHVNTPYPIQFGSGDWITVVTNATGTFTGEMTLPDGNVIAPTGKAFDLEFGQTTKWDGDRLIVNRRLLRHRSSAAAARPRLARPRVAGRLAVSAPRDPAGLTHEPTSEPMCRMHQPLPRRQP